MLQRQALMDVGGHCSDGLTTTLNGEAGSFPGHLHQRLCGHSWKGYDGEPEGKGD